MRRSLISVRVMMVLAALSLVIAGGVYSHAKEAVHSHSNVEHGSNAQHHHHHQKDECCDNGSTELVHCGANLLALTVTIEVFSSEVASRSRLERYRLLYGVNHPLDPPPPRNILA